MAIVLESRAFGADPILICDRQCEHKGGRTVWIEEPPAKDSGRIQPAAPQANSGAWKSRLAETRVTRGVTFTARPRSTRNLSM
jgi:hypothetical protein